MVDAQANNLPGFPFSALLQPLQLSVLLLSHNNITSLPAEFALLAGLQGAWLPIHHGFCHQP
jgi:hypothetical protein